ncbi:MAG: hypothetical protein M4579_001890 [Chaenotheca gracillima]|nr:MAG: hypothetical protein M4579_001890 [Chaenotheca gracillima]
MAGPDGLHMCLVHPPLHMTVSTLQRQGLTQRYNEVMLRETLLRLFRVLDFLHTVANVVHTDISAFNIMLTVDDDSMFKDFEKAEQETPTPRKIIDEKRTIYTSRSFRFPIGGLWGEPVLCDFGQARIGRCHQGDIQPERYKAPEVLFEMGWSYSADIWNVGAMGLLRRDTEVSTELDYSSQIWDIFEDKFMFDAFDEDLQYSASHHVAEMVAYFGLPPLHYLNRSEVTRNVFDEHGQWEGAGGLHIPQISLEGSEENLEGRNQELFLQFMRSMLRWVPEERKTARELLDDPWLNKKGE